MAVLVTLACGGAGLPAGLLHGAPRHRGAEGGAVHRGHAAAVVELPGAPVRVEAAAGQGGRDQLAVAAAAPGAGCSKRRCRCRPSAAVAEFLGPRHLRGLRLHVAAVHDPADPGGDRTHSSVDHRSLGRPRRRSGADPGHGDPAAGAARHRRRVDLHLLADPGRLHHSAGHRRQHQLHRAGRLQAAGRGRQRAVRGGILAGAIVVIASTSGSRRGWGPSMRSEPRAHWGLRASAWASSPSCTSRSRSSSCMPSAPRTRATSSRPRR